jgi:hypothetical protein
MYRPYRKWLIRGLARCAQHSELIPQLSVLLTSGPEGHTETVEHISRTLAAAALNKYGLELPRAGSVDKTGVDMLQSAAFLLNDHISDNDLRNTDILYAL